MAELKLKEERVDPGLFADILRRTADAIEHGGPMQITLEGQTRVLHPHGKLEVKYEVEKDEEELEFEVSWRKEPV